MKLNFFSKGMIKLFLTSLLLPLLFTSCVYKDIDGANNFQAMLRALVENSYTKLDKNISKDETVLVSDFVNLDNLQNHSKLGFLLSDTLKNSLLSKNILVREVELGNNFQIGKRGFNVLSRNSNKINNQVIDENFAVVGTYSVTTKRLIVFIKLIDVRSGTILSSSTASTLIDEEILDLERTPDSSTVYAPMVL
ncbi:FlgO family outer membrane protein [Arcobacter sp.]|uniref:FlgO family outer membrane protein n=1 Tax=unclassified Arcobacter TaxID=2593671 RepID=UPI003AFFCFAE